VPPLDMHVLELEQSDSPTARETAAAGAGGPAGSSPLGPASSARSSPLQLPAAPLHDGLEVVQLIVLLVSAALRATLAMRDSSLPACVA
jgi:hypothetical protein